MKKSLNIKAAEYIDPEQKKEGVIKPLFKMPDQPQTVIERIKTKSEKKIKSLEHKIENTDNHKDIRDLRSQIKKIKHETKEGIKNIEAAIAIDPLKFFCPNGAQERMIKETVAGLRTSPIPVVWLTCGNGVGKTTFAVETLSNIVYGVQNGWFDFDVFRNWNKPKLCWYISTATAIAETVTPMIEELWNKDLIKDREYTATKEKKSFISKIETNTGWTISFKTYDQDPAKFESAQVGLIIMDEPAPEAIWKNIKSRRRLGCLTLLPMTPLFTPPYIADEIRKNIELENPGYRWVEASVYEVSKDSEKHKGVRGHLEPDTIEAMAAAYDEDERAARIEGKMMYFSGLIYPEFQRGAHVVSPNDAPVRSDHTIYQIVDPHDARPCACIYAAVDYHGNITIFDETPNDSKGRLERKQYWEYKKPVELEKEIATWQAIEERHRVKVHYRIMDKRFGWQTRGKKTFHQLFARLGYYFSPSYDAPTGEGELMYGHREVKRKLHVPDEGQPQLRIWNTCYHTIAGFEHYVRRQMLGRAGEDKAVADGIIVEKYKDFMDLVRYLVVAAITPASQRGKTAAEILLDKITKKEYLKKKYGSRYDDL